MRSSKLSKLPSLPPVIIKVHRPLARRNCQLFKSSLVLNLPDHSYESKITWRGMDVTNLRRYQPIRKGVFIKN